MSDSLSPDEIRAAAEVHDELGPRYRDAVIESFLEKVGKEIDARVDARLGQSAPLPASRHGHRNSGDSGGRSGSPLALAVCSLVFGIPISAIAVAAGDHPAGLLGLVVVWIAIAAINIAYNVAYTARFRQPPGRR
ncbi:MAG TPA: hypothetical protein VG142_00655 [Trebonia sp.]|jgi:hypothetical protein|nr:hypothetical protein [Trebonia sp.]